MKTPLALTLLALSLCLGCSGDEGEAANDPEGCTDIPPVRELSQSCCPAHGVDACGAGLFCAAFDGRSYFTCYALHGQRGLEGCTEDAHCAHGSCNETTGRCRSAFVSEPCTTETGCVDVYQCASACPGYNSPCNSGCAIPCEQRCISR